jgi:predicted alpha/beta-fold hydrolase
MVRELDFQNEYSAAESPGSEAWHHRVQTIRSVLNEKPFIPHRHFVNGHAQTLAAYLWQRRLERRNHVSDKERLFEVQPGVRLLGRCRWFQEKRDHPTLLVVHGLEGSAESHYMLGTADKAFRSGFNVVRLNMRNCGNTEHLTPTLYHSGLSDDIRAIVNELIVVDGLRRIFVAGFSMSGNIVLKYAGENGERSPAELKGICAVSPSADLNACANAINSPSNWLYRQSFMVSLRRRIRAKHKLYPQSYDISGLSKVRTIRQFDDRYTAIDGGFRNADDYYEKSSALPLIENIRKPTLIIHAQDDPFVPFKPLTDPSVAANPYVIMLAPEHGGHVGFVANNTASEDRFWAENRVVEFCARLEQGGPVRTPPPNSEGPPNEGSGN